MNKKCYLPYNKILITEIFQSIQGEGRFNGLPVLFIRTSLCNRHCIFCDTSYSWKKGQMKTVEDLIKKIKKDNMDYVVWTGGEPLLWKTQIYRVIQQTKEKRHLLETNGDFLTKSDLKKFDFIDISPKNKETAERVSRFKEHNYEIKIVTDLDKIGVDMLEYATIVMPLTTYDKKKDKKIKRRVWDYCVKNNKRLTLRLHTEVWGKKKGK